VTAPAVQDGSGRDGGEPDGRADATRSVLGRALAVLGTFSTERAERTLGAIAQEAGLPSATAYRMVAELVAWGALERVGRGRYRIGMRLWQLGSLAPEARALRDVALPFLYDLLEVTHEVAHLVVRDGDKALYLERLMARPEVHVRSRVARKLPLHATGPGKVLLAHAPDEIVSVVLAGPLPRLARNTITDSEGLQAVLAGIRESGYCLSREETTDGASSVAAPIRGPGGDVVAALSVVVPANRPDLPSLVPAVRVAAAGISRGLRPRATSRRPT
jgi:DNA-binding IclR family transcriptional regulator